METLYAAGHDKLDYVQSLFSEIEEQIYLGKEKEMVFRISEISRKLIVFRQTLRAHDDVFRDAKYHFEQVFKSTHHDELEDVHMHFFHLLRRTVTLFETLEDFKNTNQALLSTKQNEVMKILTIMAFITFPLTLITSMFGMNTKATPVIGTDGDFLDHSGVHGKCYCSLLCLLQMERGGCNQKLLGRSLGVFGFYLRSLGHAKASFCATLIRLIVK